MFDFLFNAQSDPLSVFIKVFLLVLIGGYTIFAVVVLNQVRVMNSLINQKIVSGVLFFLAFLQVLVSASLFLLAAVIL